MNYKLSWSKITSDKLILEWVNQGVKIPFENVCNPFRRPNHNLNRTEGQFVRNEIGRLLNLGYIKQCETKPRYISPIGCVPKKTGGFRLIHDLRHLNGHVTKFPFKQEDIRTIQHIVQPKDLLTSVDLKDAFFHIPVHKDSQEYLSFYYEG